MSSTPAPQASSRSVSASSRLLRRIRGGGWLIGPVALALVVRVAYWALVTPSWIPNSDADQYVRLARAIADGDGFALVFPQLEMHATAFRPPLYPMLLSVPTAVFGDGVLWPTRLLSLIISLGVVALTAVFVRRICGKPGAVAAACAVGVMPSLIANDTVSLTEPLGLLLLLAVLLALDARRPVLVGLAAGALMLTRPNAYLVVVIAALFLWRSMGWKKALASVACSIAVVVPWSVRNLVQVDTPRLTTSEGFNLAAIYAPPAQERETFVDPVFDSWYDDTEFQLLQFDEAEWNDALTELAISSIREDPQYVLRVVGNNVLSILEIQPSNNRFAEEIDGRNLDFRGATLPLFYLYLLLGGAGLVIRIRDQRVWPAYLIVGQFIALSLLLVAPPRLRSPLDLLLCFGIGFLVDAANRHRVQRSVPVSSEESAQQEDLATQT